MTEWQKLSCIKKCVARISDSVIRDRSHFIPVLRAIANTGYNFPFKSLTSAIRS